MKKEIDNILEGFHLNEYDLLEARKKLLNLFNVSKRRELFICSFCKSDQTYLSEGGYVRTCLKCDKTARVNQ